MMCAKNELKCVQWGHFNNMGIVTFLIRGTSLKVFEGSIDCKRCDVYIPELNNNDMGILYHLQGVS